MSKPTPGPWVIDWNVSRLDVFSSDASKLVATLRRSTLSEGIDQTAIANARLIAAAPELLEALQALLNRDERNTCQHESTHRGGALWTICDSCGAQWADDEGGMPAWEDPKEWVSACAAIAKATGEA